MPAGGHLSARNPQPGPAAAEQARMPWRITALLVLCGAAVTAAPESVLGHAGYLCCFLLIVVAGWQAVRLGARAARSA